MDTLCARVSENDHFVRERSSLHRSLMLKGTQAAHTRHRESFNFPRDGLGRRVDCSLGWKFCFAGGESWNSTNYLKNLLCSLYTFLSNLPNYNLFRVIQNSQERIVIQDIAVIQSVLLFLINNNPLML